jgi:TolB-like protein
VAVLPFVNEGHDPDSDYLSDGITESIIDSLSQLPNLRVMGRSTVFRYKGKETDPQKVGEELKVGVVLTGRVRERGQELVIRADLVKVSDGTEIWGARYDRKLSQAQSVPEDIARVISEKLSLKLTGGDQRKLAKRQTGDPESYQLYLKGQSIRIRAHSKTSRRASSTSSRRLKETPQMPRRTQGWPIATWTWEQYWPTFLRTRLFQRPKRRQRGLWRLTIRLPKRMLPWAW